MFWLANYEKNTSNGAIYQLIAQVMQRNYCRHYVFI